MASSALLTLDLTAPDAAVNIESGASITSVLDVALAITSAAADKAQMKIYGDVSDTQAPAEYRTTEANAPWISFAAAKTVRLAAGDGVKTVRVKVRDDVNNTSTEATDTITLNTAIPVISILTGPSSAAGGVPPKASKQTGFDTWTLTFQSDVALDQWQVRLVTNATDSQSSGALIPETGGSDTQGTALAAATSQTVTIKGVDLEAAGASGAGATGTQARIKVFGRSSANQQWSAGS